MVDKDNPGRPAMRYKQDMELNESVGGAHSRRAAPSTTAQLNAVSCTTALLMPITCPPFEFRVAVGLALLLPLLARPPRPILPPLLAVLAGPPLVTVLVLVSAFALLAPPVYAALAPAAANDEIKAESSVVYVASAGVPAGAVTGAFCVAVTTPFPPAVEQEPNSTHADCALFVVKGGAPCCATDRWQSARSATDSAKSVVVEVRGIVRYSCSSDCSRTGFYGSQVLF